MRSEGGSVHRWETAPNGTPQGPMLAIGLTTSRPNSNRLACLFKGIQPITMGPIQQCCAASHGHPYRWGATPAKQSIPPRGLAMRVTLI
jgi:hypothetical protein